MSPSFAQKTQPPTGGLTFTYSTIIAPGATLTEPQGISNKGVVVGAYWDGSDNGFAVQDGIFSTYSPYYESALSGMNASGEMVGSYEPDYGGDPPQGFTVIDGVLAAFNVPNVTGTLSQPGSAIPATSSDSSITTIPPMGAGRDSYIAVAHSSLWIIPELSRQGRGE